MITDGGNKLLGKYAVTASPIYWQLVEERSFNPLWRKDVSSELLIDVLAYTLHRPKTAIPRKPS